MSFKQAIVVDNISKSYQIYDNSKDRLKQMILRGYKKYYREFWALQNISFEVNKGETVGIIGRNGSGKSTLLQIIAGILTPTTGSISVHGRVAALLELGSGFDPEYTGRENVFINGNILGISHREMEERFEEIQAFADIGDFIDQPVKTYSSGMIVRLAFAVQACVDPEILIIDEALAVGDILFQKRCFSRMKTLAEKGTTLLFVTHDIELVRTLTSRAILLEGGQIVKEGPSAEVVLEYRRRMHKEESAYYQRLLGTPTTVQENNVAVEMSGSDKVCLNNLENEDLAFGDKDAVILDIKVADAAGETCSIFYPGDEVKIRIKCKTIKSCSNLNIGLRIRNKTGIKICSWGSLNQDIAIWSGRAGGKPFWTEDVAAGTILVADFKFICCLGADLYEVQAFVSREDDQYYRQQRMLHWIDEAAHFQVNMRQQEYFFGGIFDLQMKAIISEQRDNLLEKKGFVL
ncbi:Teichoic acids export ATP-binding protein TagH [Pelotomaculum sp. FP]|uniref:ABC transporter ATP-binding protein n=1 Tax=Pelotomaculum sp. FP TaxID=261474 RepID=UPI001065E384|nr:ABC transporter ATP-binding protein [Pelotomaculum sp. FP]TEB16175.1 Teichoic acids export ATP-binding protein TagH [Pelotomaculum sp. FP]